MFLIINNMRRKAIIKGIEFDPDNISDEEKEDLRVLDEKSYLFIFESEEFKRIYIQDKTIKK
ncbi:MAG: hypothetical protein A2V66_17115 [Ignavibacteria bacterium RBG_13_36_8]|nr:MAG: hypothetical protein A2V66_17115 [Ignavibacteria bacterium RBG_13_36_8]